MTDLEMTKLCAEAMGWIEKARRYGMKIDPLHDDAQAMALVKKFHISIGAPFPDTPQWECEIGGRFLPSGIKPFYGWATKDLNRAIVMSVAKMQAYK